MKHQHLVTNEQAAVLVGRTISRAVAVDDNGVANAFIILDDNTVLSFSVEDHGSGTYTVRLETGHPYIVQKAARLQIAAAKKKIKRPSEPKRSKRP